MEEKLISFETAKLAKEMGFGLYSFTPSGCVSMYNDNTNEIEHLLMCQSFPYDYQTICVSQSLLQRWLREEHNFIISVVPFYNNTTGICTLEGYTFLIFEKESFEAITNDEDYKTYEEALEKGLQETLKLI